MEVPPGLQWRVYYADENNDAVITRDNFDFEPDELPTTHAIAINQLIDNRRDCDRITGSDNYLWIESLQLWTGSDDDGVAHRDQASTDYIRLYGIWAPTPLYQKVRATCMTDSDFPNALDKDSMSSMELSIFEANIQQELERIEREREEEPVIDGGGGL